MKKFAFALCTSLCLILPALAQSNAAAPSSEGTGGGQSNPMADKMKQLVQSCRKTAHEAGLTPKSPEMRKSVIECVAKERPGMANVLRCRFEGMDKGLKPGADDMKAFVKECMKHG